MDQERPTAPAFCPPTLSIFRLVTCGPKKLTKTPPTSLTCRDVVDFGCNYSGGHSGLRSTGKPRHDCSGRNERDHFDGARYHDCQCRASPHAGELVRNPGSDDLGADLVHHSGRYHDAADRLAGGSFWAQAPVSVLGYRFHDRLRPLRHGSVAIASGRIPVTAGTMRRVVISHVPSSAFRYLSEGPS